MFDAESLAFLRDGLQEVVINPAAEPDGVYLVREADGYYRTVQAFPPHRRYRALSIGGLVSMAAMMAGDEDGDSVDIFIGDKAIVAVAREADRRRDTVTLELQRSEQFAAMEKGALIRLDHEAFVLAFMTTFRDRATDPGFLPIIRDLRFKSDDQGHSRVAHAGGSMGRAVELEVAGWEGGSIPEVVALNIPVFRHVPDPADPYHATVQCTLVVDASNRKLSLAPLPGELDQALAAARHRADMAIQSSIADLERLTETTQNRIRVRHDSEYAV